MNPRIRQLVEQAMVTVPAAEGPISHTYFDKEKFAQLIVRECSQISRDHQRNYYESHGDRIAKKIKEHFGVEE